MSVGILIVSHSSKIAEGTKELAEQMAEDVTIVAAGGTDDGGIGTSFQKVMDGISAADSGDGVVILTDLGSAILTTESVLDFLDDEMKDRIRLVNAALVKGAIAAATKSQIDGSLDECASAAERALHPSAEPDFDDKAEVRTVPENNDDVQDITVNLTLTNEVGLHARPAAKIVNVVGKYDSEAWINGKNASSALMLMTLKATKGTSVEFRAKGSDAQDLVDEMTALFEDNFGEE